MNDRMLEGKIALITGASSGIGRGAASVFARHGARLVLADINVDGGAETVRLVQEAGGEAIFVKADVSKAGEVEALIQQAVGRFGRLDCALNNAGIDGQVAATADCTEENWDQVLAVNLKGVWLCMKYQIPQMLAQGGGAIVNTSSAAGLVGYPGLCAYVASKHGVVGLTRAAALEYGKQNIQINAICPGAIRTPMLDEVIRNGLFTEEQAAAMEPIGRLGTVEEVGETAAWLCSGRASFVLGHALAVDGGMTAV
jgi:NAD(P)-dependent dehydrogenase (short-subunit alcohol dehydrogenase family)